MPRRKMPYAPRPCLQCKVDFEPWSIDTRFCGKACYGKWAHQKKRADEGFVREGRTCDECAGPIAHDARTDIVYCSPRCRAKVNARIGNIRKMGIQPEAFAAMLAAQGGTCAVVSCDKGVNENGRRLHIDHDHNCCPGRWSCGECIRGLLCDRHNLILGLIDDDIDGLLALVDYLTATRAKAVA